MAENILYRAAEFDRAQIDAEARTVALAFSSETPVKRWFGDEVLSHESTAVRLGRLKNSGALLLDHDPAQQIGVVESVKLEGGKGRAVVRFSRSAKGEEIFQDVRDGIRKHISVGYIVHKQVEDKAAETVRVTDWEPLEVSIVSIPADTSVGVGRSLKKAIKQELEHMSENITEQRAESPQKPAAAQVVDLSAARADEVSRIRELNALGEAHQLRELAARHIQDGTGVAEFRGLVLEELSKRKDSGVTVAQPLTGIGLTEKETKKYSMLRAMRALANPGDRRARQDAAFEFEASEAVAKEMGREARGIYLPPEIAGRRDLTVGTSTAGGYLVDNQMLPMIDTLENSMIVGAMGATMLTGLRGDIAIPKKTSGATAYWINEGGAATESQPAIGQLAMTPKTLSAYTEISRKLMQQSSIDVEAWVRNDLALRLALALDLAAIKGSGTNFEPRGILNYAGIGSVVGGTNGAAPDWADAVNLESAVAVDNALTGNLGYLTNTSVVGKLKQTEKATGTAQFVMEGGINDGGFMSMNGYRVGVSNQVPSNLVKGSSGAVCSAIIFGNWSDLVIGMWGGLDVTVDPYSNSTTGAVRIVVFMDADLQLRHEQSFAAMKDALTA